MARGVSHLQDVRHLGQQLVLVQVDDLLHAAHQVLLGLLVLVRESAGRRWSVKYGNGPDHGASRSN